ncbi:taurine ABC transporter substrate-binding protein [Corynebacterium terpenotabidum]|uniref:Glycine betaine ABC transporter substrate-binding protein n=1 Tax=Corynebacterium terpenotabidum Y-11 TaxID=1200352 RepID=S4XH56_9CORY|nr:ABC transporter substrate-binding protein [Corynebacterium terpenotabidum]AGP30995.1 glycine betaine ABC transporter substrate-binding protein [Corynebacterium terpenotabidum Y-11]
MSFRRTLAIAAASLVALFGTSACVAVGPPASHWAEQNSLDCPFEPDESITTHVTLAYQMIPNGDRIVQNQRMLETCMPNASIEWKRFESAGDVLQAYGAGSIDYGLLGSSGLARGLSAPLSLDLVTPWVFDEIGEAESLVVKDDAITDIEGLRGKTIAVTYSSTSHYSLLGALDQAGMEVGQDVKLVNLSPDRMLAGWQSDQIDAAFVWDPTLSELMESGHVITSAKEAAEGGAPTYDLATFTRSFVEENPEFMVMWARAQDEAVRQIIEDPDTAAGSIAAVLGLDAETVLTQLTGYAYPRATEQASDALLGRDLGTLLYDTASFLKDNQEVDAVADAETYSRALYPDAAAAVAAGK